ncbi:hypothetical protein GPECTOR_137g648 [Gonium pectorale]|uniref:Uncharacterized protein n=1 Tax=Gonium pectorale TaxID=33097 RepID=A0A150FY48_GONPE|nr:hypothetical protein GPECTOR_137g648 [Gonium pectorale]|eukprot:KXZ42541.1 hypothetical protein GPECTOR_137g648 [Gonium pectorale]
MVLAAAGVEHLEGRRDGAREHIQALFLQPAGRQNALLLDEVVVAFIDTNVFKQRRYTAQELLTCAPSWGRPKHFKFVHANVPYLATVDFWEGPDVDFVVVRLPNNGFAYVHREEEEFVRHRSDGRVELDGTLVMEFFPGLARVIRDTFTNTVFYYNYTDQRFDVQLFTDDADAVGLMLTFERGYPYVDDQSQRLPLRRR